LTQLFDIGRPGKTGTLGEKGTGLGLIICKEFVEKNNGRVWVTENEPTGHNFLFLSAGQQNLKFLRKY
jgi:signal transduction histidine kinase